MNTRLTSAVLGSVLAGTFAFGGVAAAQEIEVDNVFEVEVEANGANGVLDAVDDALDALDLELFDGDIDIAVVEVEDSLNNLQALNNVLNNNDIDVDIQDVSVLSDNQIEILEQANIDIDDVIGVDILDGGDFLVIVAD